jgi:hypothetical protein
MTEERKKNPREREKIQCYLKNGYFVTVNQPVRDDDRKRFVALTLT